MGGTNVCSISIKCSGGKDDYAVKVQGVEILPDPVVRGKPATFNISATTGISFYLSAPAQLNLSM
jgi:hypothetical protein